MRSMDVSDVTIATQDRVTLEIGRYMRGLRDLSSTPTILLPILDWFLAVKITGKYRSGGLGVFDRNHVTGSCSVCWLWTDLVVHIVNDAVVPMGPVLADRHEKGPHRRYRHKTIAPIHRHRLPGNPLNWSGTEGEEEL